MTQIVYTATSAINAALCGAESHNSYSEMRVSPLPSSFPPCLPCPVKPPVHPFPANRVPTTLQHFQPTMPIPPGPSQHPPLISPAFAPPSLPKDNAKAKRKRLAKVRSGGRLTFRSFPFPPVPLPSQYSSSFPPLSSISLLLGLRCLPQV